MLFDAISQVELFVTVFASVYALALVVYVLLSWFRVPSTLGPVQRFLRWLPESAMFVPDGVLMAPSREAANGRKCVERLLRDLGEEGYSDMRVETIRVENSGDMAMEVGRYSVTIRQANGTLIPERGKYVKVWRRLGAWLILADCWSRNPPVTQ